MTVRTVVRIFLQLLYVQWLQQLLEIFIKITVRTVTSQKLLLSSNNYTYSEDFRNSQKEHLTKRTIRTANSLISVGFS